MICRAAFGLCVSLALATAIAAPGASNQASYQLPTDGPLPRTYLVTLAAVDLQHPEWIISQFVAGAPRTVTAENQGRFTETWNGLDDNFMPVPPGTYGVKGIYMPAERWPVDGEYHAVTARFVGGASPWLPSPDDWKTPEPFGGDPCDQPLGDVAVGPNGIGVFYYVYLENGRNCPLFDLNKPLGLSQFVQAFNSGGAAGGTSVATDGQSVWAFSTDGGPKFVYRADGKSFGHSPGANRTNAYRPDGWVAAMAAWHGSHAPQARVFVAQRGRIVEKDSRRREFVESDTPVDKLTVHDGGDGRVLAELPLKRPVGLAVRGDTLYALHGAGTAQVVDAIALRDGLPAGDWHTLLRLPPETAPGGLAVDRGRRIYVSDPLGNHVLQYDAQGQFLRKFGRLDAQRPGSYDPETLMMPGKLAAWTDAAGKDRLIIVERAGPNRASEWSADGKLVREFLALQTRCNNGYAVDAERPEHIYVPGHEGWLTRFRVDYATGQFTIDAVWPEVGTDPAVPGLVKPVFLRAKGRCYLAGASGAHYGGYNVYRLDGDRWKFSASILRRPAQDTHQPYRYYLWHDANGNGRLDEEELTAADAPGWIFCWHGQNWSEDFSFLALAQNGPDLWRLAPSGFDAHGNPVFTAWQRLLTDPVFAARAEGKADAVHGGNELAQTYSSDWFQADGTPQAGYWIQARGGKSFSANEGAQYKVSHYVPDGQGGYRLQWRAGRAAINGPAQRGEFYGGMRIRRPINGITPVIDQSRCGVLLYDADGLYVDTLFPDSRRLGPQQVGLYSLPGEFFAGLTYPHPGNGNIYFALGKYTPLLFQAQGWSTTLNPSRRLEPREPTIALDASQISDPPEIALAVRGGAGTAQLARFAPALGGAVLDGSMLGWESCEPLQFGTEKAEHVEVRCLYDPEHFYLRWHVRLGHPLVHRSLPPLERIFTHDQAADTLSFYLQGDASARPGRSTAGRPGDVRFVFGLFQEAGQLQPACVGMYPAWTGPDARPQVYRTPVGEAAFAHVGRVAGVQLTHVLDADRQGFVLAAAIPRAAVPHLAAPLAGGYRTQVNFEATLAGHNKFWWANRDGSASRETYDEPTEARLYPGSWAPAQFQGLEAGVPIRRWLICGPWGGPEAERFCADPRDKMPGTNIDWKQAVRQFCQQAVYLPDTAPIDFQARYQGEQLRGYWNPGRELRWREATIADLDTRVRLGPSGQVWYAASWIYAPQETAVEFQFQGHPMTPLCWKLNGRPLDVRMPEHPADALNRCIAVKTFTLQAGWNQVLVRAYGYGYPPARAGLVLGGPPETLWKLRLSAVPPGK